MIIYLKPKAQIKQFDTIYYNSFGEPLSVVSRRIERKGERTITKIATVTQAQPQQEHYEREKVKTHSFTDAMMVLMILCSVIAQ